MNKLQKMTQKPVFKRVLSFLMIFAIMGCMAIPAFAAEGDTSVANDAVSAVSSAFSTVTSTISVGNILKMVGIALGACVAFFFFWWGIRKVIKMVTNAFKKGKVSV